MNCPRYTLYTLLIALLLTVTACDPMAVRPEPQVIVITDTPTFTPQMTPTPSATRTPAPTATPDFTPTPTPFPCEGDGQIFEISDFRSASTRETLPYLAYVPPCYFETTRRFPVVFLIHERGFRETQWRDLGIASTLDRGIRLGVLPPMIVIMPAMGTIGTRDSFPPSESYETVLLDELLPAVEADFCVIPQRASRAIGGIGRGGFWALTIAMRFPEVFSAVGSHSGELTDRVPAQFNPLEIARNSTFLPTADLRYYLDNPARDTVSQGQQTLSDRLTARQIAHTYVINPIGERNNEYWSSQLSAYLAFYGAEWARTYDTLPSCLE